MLFVSSQIVYNILLHPEFVRKKIVLINGLIFVKQLEQFFLQVIVNKKTNVNYITRILKGIKFKLNYC